MIKVNGYICPKCSDKVFSRANHDYRNCTCGEIAVDGGFSYSRIAFKDIVPKSIELEIDSTKKDLYDDWNYRRDLFGIIKGDIMTELKKKYVIDTAYNGEFDSDDIDNMDINKFIKIFDDIRKKHPNVNFRINLDENWRRELFLRYTGTRIETDEEFESRKIKIADKKKKKLEGEEKRRKEKIEYERLRKIYG